MKQILLALIVTTMFSFPAAYAATYRCELKANGKTLSNKLVTQESAAGDGEYGTAKLGRYEISVFSYRDVMEGPTGRGQFVPFLSYEVRQTTTETGANYERGLSVKHAEESDGRGFRVQLKGDYSEVSIGCKKQA